MEEENQNVNVQGENGRSVNRSLGDRIKQKIRKKFSMQGMLKKFFAEAMKKAVIAFIVSHIWIIVGAVGLGAIATIYGVMGSVSSDHSTDSVDKTINKSSIADTSILTVSNLINFQKNNNIKDKFLIASNNIMLATSDVEGSTENTNDDENIISDEAKLLYNEKRSLILLKLSQINMLYEDYVDQNIPTEELDLMTHKMGTEAPGSNDDEILLNGTMTTINFSGGEGGSYSGDIVINGKLKDFNTRDPNNVNSPNSLELTSEQISSFSDYLNNTTSQRKKMVLKALSAVGKVHYSQTYRNPSADMPAYLDCSSFVYWAYTKSGLGAYSDYVNTATMINSLKAISSKDLQPGDLMFKTSKGVHVVMFIGWTENGNALIVELLKYKPCRPIW